MVVRAHKRNVKTLKRSVVFLNYSYVLLRTLQGFLAIVYRNLAEYHVFSVTSGMSQSGTAGFRFRSRLRSPINKIKNIKNTLGKYV